MTKRVALGLGLAITAAAAACADGYRLASVDGPPSVSPETTGNPSLVLCPNCIPRRGEAAPQAGGETSDFGGAGGGNQPCSDEEAPLTEALAEEYRLFDELERAQADLEVDVRLRDERGEALSGQTEPTTLVAHVSLGEPVYYQRVPTSPTVTCGEGYISVPASVALDVGNGIIAAETLGRLSWQASADRPWVSSLLAFADLSNVRGTLNLHLDPSLVLQGSLALDVTGFREGRRGSLSIDVRQFPDEETASAGRRIGTNYRNVTGHFPDDRCGQSDLPIDATTPHAWLGGVSFGELYAGWRSKILAAGPQRARWRNREEVDVSIEPGLPSQICLGAHGVEFETTARLTTSDGRVDMTLPAASTALAFGRRYMRFSVSKPFPAEEFERESGIRGIEPGGYSWLQAGGNVSLKNLDTDVIAFCGSFFVSGGERVDGNVVCPSGSCVIDELEWVYSDQACL